MLLATLFQDELEAEGNATAVPTEFMTALTKLKQPGYGAQRRARLGQKPESKATPKPVGVGTKSATPARARTATGMARVPAPSSNEHGGYRPKSMPAMPAARARQKKWWR